MKIGIFLGNLGNPAIYYPKLAKITGGVTAVFFCANYCNGKHNIPTPANG